MTKQRSKSGTKQAKGTRTRFYQSWSGEQMMIAGIVAVSLIIVGAIALNSYLNRPVDIAAVEVVPIVSASHIEDPNQGDADHDHEDDTEHEHEEDIATEEDIARFDEQGLPPAGGPHYAQWLNCGIYDSPVPTGNALHSLEHGAVWIAYHPDLSADDVDTLRDVVSGSSRRILSPYPNLVAPIVVTAWGYRLRLDNPDDAQLQQFIRNYQDAASAPEPGASCSSGLGSPIG